MGLRKLWRKKQKPLRLRLVPLWTHAAVQDEAAARVCLPSVGAVGRLSHHRARSAMADSAVSTL